MKTRRAIAIVGALLLGAACGGETKNEGEPEASIAVAGPGGVATVDQPVLEGTNPTPASVPITISNSGNCALNYLATARTVDGTEWMGVGAGVVSPSGITGTSPAASGMPPIPPGTSTINLFFSTATLRPGTYTGTVTVTGTCATNGRTAAGSPAFIPVNLTVTQLTAALAVTPDRVEVDIVTLQNRWRATSELNAPAPRYFHTAVWTGYEMIVFGGVGGGTLGSGGRYDPSLNTWNPLPPIQAGSATAFYRHSAVWTGTDMILWGGLPGLLPVGVRYNPSSDLWTEIDALDPDTPMGRVLHTAVWTGTQMIVWGGAVAFGPMLPELGTNSGGRFSATGWQRTSTVNAPSPRWGHTAVWTGSRMIVFGGTSSPFSGAELGNGGIYDPVLDVWEPLPATSAPSPRHEHVAVFTGSKMIVWGGLHNANPGTAFTNTGAIFDLATRTWTAMPTTNAPEARSGATAVWTGSRMIVWGGFPGFSSGGIFDPNANPPAWEPMGTGAMNEPSPRYYHTVVWTGQAMIVYGGTGASLATTGGLFD